jgi:hypothetical protein
VSVFIVLIHVPLDSLGLARVARHCLLTTSN